LLETYIELSSEDSESLAYGGTQDARLETVTETEMEMEEDTPKPKKKAIKYKKDEESDDDWGEFQTPKGLRKALAERAQLHDFIDTSKTDPEPDVAGRTDTEDEDVHQADVAQTHQQSKGESS
jgi:hypothetical protein